MELAYAPATYALILANLMASLWAFHGDPQFASNFAFNVGAISRAKQHYRIFTSSFLHGDYMHLAFNMLTLFYFGPVVEHLLGTDGFLVVYFGAVMASGIVSFYVNRKNLMYSSLGASDAVSGVVLSFCVFAPFHTIYFMMVLPMPAIVFAVLFIVISATLVGRQGGRIAHEAHLAGAFAGILLTIAMRPEVVTRFFS